MTQDPQSITRPDPNRIDDPQHWRDRAEEARKMANAIGDTVARAKMQDVAAEYDCLAEQTEAHKGRTCP